MVARVSPKQLPYEEIVLKFGGGINSRASEDEIDPRECADGRNFVLDLENREFRNRDPFDLAGTSPTGNQINGFAQLLMNDGTISTLVQSGTDVYRWDGGDTFTHVGTVTAGTKIRGRLESNWTLDEKVLIADLGGVNPVLEWDGTTLSEMVHNLTGDFIAKYIFVSGEAAWYANVSSNSVSTPHLLARSKISDYDNLTVSNKPSSSLGADDPFHVLTPDLRPINGIVEAFGLIAVSSKKGNFYKMTGADATDFAIQSLYPRSNADGEEAIIFIGNDIIYGRQGRIETLAGTERFGDVETDDLSRRIADTIEDYTSWTAAYNARLQRAYFIPSGQAEMWVLHKSLLEGNLSPWAKWTTQHASSFQPTAMMTMLDPEDGLEKVFLGDSSGSIYRLEGTGTGDGGSADIRSERLSKLFSVPLDAQMFDVQGYVKYRSNEAATLTLTLEWAGQSVFDESITINIPAIANRPVYGGGIYYNDDKYYGTPFSGKLTRQKFSIAGKSSEFQVRATVEGSTDFQINELGLRFQAAS